MVSATIVEDGNAVATLQCNVIIGPAAVSIKLTKTSLVLMTGMQKRLYANVLPLNTVEKPMFGSTDTEIAKVSSVGRVRAVQPGSVQIYAMLDNGECSVCDVTVLNDEDYAKYLDGKSIDEILTENAEEPDDEIIDEFTDEDNGEESGSDNEEKAKEPVAEEITDKTEKTTDRDGSADKTVQDTSNAVEEK
ncbi:MAG: Ig-like domain-containing protein [Lachnospiraceae bacterium]|nr:Ig-like domain-containing protein [Lachnospiraceae bacterium]